MDRCAGIDEVVWRREAMRGAGVELRWKCNMRRRSKRSEGVSGAVGRDVDVRVDRFNLHRAGQERSASGGAASTTSGKCRGGSR